MVNAKGFLKVYRLMPWVKPCEIDDVSFFLRDEDRGTYREIAGYMGCQIVEYSSCCFSYINMLWIMTVTDGIVKDDFGVEYPYCELLLSNQLKFYLPYHWSYYLTHIYEGVDSYAPGVCAAVAEGVRDHSTLVGCN